MSTVWFAAPMLCSCRSRGRRSPAASAPQRDTGRTPLRPKNAVGTRSTSGGNRSPWPPETANVRCLFYPPYPLAVPTLIALPETEAQASSADKQDRSAVLVYKERKNSTSEYQ